MSARKQKIWRWQKALRERCRGVLVVRSKMPDKALGEFKERWAQMMSGAQPLPLVTLERERHTLLFRRLK